MNKCLILSLAALFAINSVRGQSPVTVTEVDENIPTYMSGAPEPNPMFFFGRGTQGAEQRIYPYPLYDNLTNVKADKSYNIIYLENEWVKIGISPELGGRIFSAVDKTNGYDFIYRQHVIKPALIGLTGAWISGGVEWNIPHHHRASTFSPVQWSVEESPDGSKTVWVGELEIRHRMRWAVGYTLRPGSSIVECNIRISNRTPVENTMLCFANIAVHIDENYQVLFPPRTERVTGHSKRSFNDWPMINGADLSWYKNNTGSASWFAVNEEDDFVAGYDHGKKAGIMIVANHHIVQGKKFFTWGVGNMWDNILTDADGPYLEIMVGAYSDNQPDYSWLQSGEERSFNMSLSPFRDLAGMKNATLEAAVNLDVAGGKARYGFYTTSAFRGAVIEIRAGERVLATRTVDIDPGKPFTGEVAVPAGVKESDVRASISAADGRELVAYSPVVLEPTPVPTGYREPGAPESFQNTEELFLAGQRIDQFHNPSMDADPYWEEVLKRDPDHIEANTGMGRLALRNAKYDEAAEYFQKAVNRLTAQFTISKNVEPLYYLGLAQRGRGKLDEAFTTLYKAAWKQEWKAPAYLALAEIASTQGRYAEALELVNESLDANTYNVRAYVLRSALLRHLGKAGEALELVKFALDKTDPLDTGLAAEQWLASGADGGQNLFATLADHPVNAEEVAAGYMNAGMWGCGIKVLNGLVSATADKTKISPLVYYYLGYFAEQRGDAAGAAEYRAQAARQPMDYVFPFQQEMIPVLRSAIAANPRDARAPYYLGNLLYDWQPAEATALWEKSSSLDPGMAIVWRNLAIAYSHDNGADSNGRAIAALEKAVALPNVYPTHLAELDGLYRAGGTPVAKRLAVLEKNRTAVLEKDDALGAMINLEIFTGKAGEAIELMRDRVFNLWEGGSAFNTSEGWANAHLVRGLQAYDRGDYKAALADFQSALTPPGNLRAERLSTRADQIRYWTGAAYEALGNKREARRVWTALVDGTPADGRAGRNRSAAMMQAGRYFIALARRKLDPKADVQTFFRELTDTENNTRVTADGTRDYQFVRVNTPQSADNRAYPHYLAGLGWLALGDNAKARTQFETALKESPDFLGARIELDMLNSD